MSSFRERETARLRVRPVASEDVDALVEIHVDARTHVHTPGGAPSPEQARAMLASFVASWAAVALSYWSVELGGRVIGVAGVEVHQVLGRACWNLYYRFAPDAWGHGYATEVALEAVKVAQVVDPALPIVARTRASNAPALRVAERAGLTRRPDLDHDGLVVLATNWPVASGR